jgi:hypothetical protein
MVREIIEANNWQRPIYFAVTCSDDSKIGMHDYLRMEGMAFRFVPEKENPVLNLLSQIFCRHSLLKIPDTAETFSRV